MQFAEENTIKGIGLERLSLIQKKVAGENNILQQIL